MDRIRLIASDMDATLLDEYSQLPPKFTETIRALAGQGILFAAASGRPLYTLETMFPDLLEEIILIGDNGGAARWKGKDLFVSEMPAEGWRQLARSTKQAGDVGLLCGLQAAYAEKQDEKYDKVFKNFYTRVEYVDDLTAVEAAADKFTVYLPNDDSQKAFDRIYGAFHTGNGGAFSVAVAGKLGGRDEPRCAQGCSTGKGGCTAGHSGRQHDGLWRHLQRCRDAHHREVRLFDGERQRTAAGAGVVPGTVPPGIRRDAGAETGAPPERRSLAGGFCEGALKRERRFGMLSASL